MSFDGRHCIAVLVPAKAKAHKHKQFCPVTAWVRGGVSRPGGQWSNDMSVVRGEPKEHKHFRPGTRPGGPVTEIVHVPDVDVPFKPLKASKTSKNL